MKGTVRRGIWQCTWESHIATFPKYELVDVCQLFEVEGEYVLSIRRKKVWPKIPKIRVLGITFRKGRPKRWEWAGPTIELLRLSMNEWVRRYGVSPPPKDEEEHAEMLIRHREGRWRWNRIDQKADLQNVRKSLRRRDMKAREEEIDESR